jgi:predicted DNA-binding transcriptional regulator YafY
MRHENSERLLRLCLLIAGSHGGITLSKIMEEFAVSRRTAERMRDATLRLLPDITETVDDAGIKHWRSPQAPRGLTAITATDIATLNSAASLLDAVNRQDQANALRGLSNRLLARQDPAWKRRTDPDLELLLESEGIAHRAGPVVRIAPDVLRKIRDAILASVVLRITYSGRANSNDRQMEIEAYGLLYGARPFLIGRVPGKPDLRHFRVQGIRTIQLLDTPFERDPEFDMNTYRAQLFGSFREPPFRNVWRFAPSAAADAAEYQFHPTQTSETCADGSLLVRFTAGGLLEMSWHLMTWGDAVEVLDPPDFWEQVNAQLPGKGRA